MIWKLISILFLQYSDPSVVKNHTHPPDAAAEEVLEMRLKMREQASHSKARPVDVVATALYNASDEAKLLSGRIQTIKRDIRKARQRRFPRVPKSVVDFEIPEDWKTTGGGSPKSFLVHDSGAGTRRRLVVFATGEQLRFLAQSETWFLDGTFKMSSHIFQQVYVVRGEHDGKVCTCVYALLTEKTTLMYEDLLTVIKRKMEELGFQPKPKSAMLDFESAAMNAVASVLGPEVSVKGCFYHLCQSTWRNIQEKGLVKVYKEDASIKLFCGMVDALAFLPTKDVAVGMELLWGHAPFELADLLLYFDTTYVSGLVGKQPLFPPSVWNVHEATLNNTHRTNNVCESWNNKFSHLVGHHNPSIWTVLEALQKDEATQRRVLLINHPDEVRKKRSNVEHQERLRGLCVDFNSGRKNVYDFLRAVGNTIRF